MKRTLLFMLPILVFIGLGNCGILGGEDKEKPILWEEESLGESVLYTFGIGFDTLAVIDLETGSFEKISHFKGIRSIVSTIDGKKLFVSTAAGIFGSGPGTIYAVDPITWEYEAIYEKAAGLITNLSGEIFFFTKLEYDESNLYPISEERVFGEIDVQSNKVSELGRVYIDSNDGSGSEHLAIELHPELPLLYAVDSNYRFYKYNYETQERTYLFEEVNFNPASYFVLSSDGNTAYFPKGPVLDLKRNRQMGSINLPFFGTAAVRKDNKEVYITDYGNAIAPGDTESFYVYDPESNSISDTVFLGNNTDLVFLTPNERYAIVNTLVSYYIIDLREREIFKKYSYYRNGRRQISTERIYLAPNPNN
ncbi:MAG: hypothetical protein JJ966_01235 [Balneolaceae bacterium]|nr:hypothetical protein [Balneolaceae bacterium]